jgi:hypothetical protein
VRVVKLVAAALAVVLVALTPVLGGRPAGAATTTLYLHSLPGSTVGQETVEAAGRGTGPTMDTSPPTGPDPKVASPRPGNPNFRKNFLLDYWTAPLHASVATAAAHLWVSAPAPTKLTVSLFSGPGLGVSTPFATASADVPLGGPAALDVMFDGQGFGVLRTIVLQLSSDGPVAVLYDSQMFPSSLDLDLLPFQPAPPIAWTPQPGFGPVSAVSTTLAQRETSLAIDPTDENRMFVCSPSGVPNNVYGQSYFHATTDAGATWHPLYVETAPLDTRRAALEGGDCDVAYDAGGTMYSADTWLGSLSVGASQDHGENWSGTALAATAPVVDRPWLAGGPGGTVHVTWQDLQFAMPTAIWYSRSTDFAQTFLPAVPVVVADPAQPLSWEGNLVVAPSGSDLYLVYTRRSLGSLFDPVAETVWVASSHDGGATWSSQQIATRPTPASFLYPSIARDGLGALHVVFASPTDDAQPVWYTTSTDGVVWSAPVKLLDGVAGFAPWVAAGPTGDVAVEWLGTHDAQPDLGKPHDWYVFWARITNGQVTVGTTTSTPIFSGVQSDTPEFNQVRLDSTGRMRFGSSVNFTGPEDTAWAIVYQSGPPS